MKQKDIKINNWYLFARSIHDHRQHLVGTAVKVIGRLKGRKRPNGHKSADRFKLKTGDKATATEIEPLGPCKFCGDMIVKQPFQLHYMRFCSVDCLETYKDKYEYGPH